MRMVRCISRIQILSGHNVGDSNELVNGWVDWGMGRSGALRSYNLLSCGE